MKRLLLVGQYWGMLGIPNHARNMAEGFIKYQTEFDIRILPLYPCPNDPFQANYGQTDLLKEHYVTEEQAKEFDPTHVFIFWNPIESYSKMVTLLGRENRCYISFALHEWTIFDKAFVQALNSFDYCACPSSWSKQIYIENNISPDKIIMFPCGVDEAYLQSSGHKDGISELPSSMRKSFLFVGKIENRKSFDETIITFDKATKGLEDKAHLKVLAFSQFRDLDVRNYIKKLVPDNTNIFPFFARIDSIDKMRMVYEHSDYLLMPSRAGAIELPLLEAMACGCVPIAIAYSGMKDYLPNSNEQLWPWNIGIKDFIDIYDPIYFPLRNVGKWAEPNWSNLEFLIRSAISTPSNIYKAYSTRVFNHIRDNFIWSKIIPKFVKSLTNV